MCQQGHALSKALGEDTSFPLPAAGVCQQPLAILGL